MDTLLDKDDQMMERTLAMTPEEKLHAVKSLVEEGGVFLQRHVPLDKRHFIVKFTWY